VVEASVVGPVGPLVDMLVVLGGEVVGPET
jgi:hypothetical protein